MKRLIILLLSVTLLIGPFALASAAADQNSYVGTVITKSLPLNVRSGAGASHGIVTSLKKGSYVTILSRVGGWYKIEYAAGKYGYCSAEYISTVAGSYATSVSLSSGYLNVRSGPGTNYGSIGKLYAGSYVTVISSANGWSRILYNGSNVGYASSLYLGKAQPTTALQPTFLQPTYKKIALSVPAYKQTDSRWSSVTVGSSGRTIGAIGCATTALAMSESYRLGYTITPSMMEQRLSYTPGGAVYWPSNYVTTSTSAYLSTIYTQLSSGKPVLLGAKTSAGAMHWVIVTGYTGGENLTASRFTISDPGSNSRKTLADLFAAYQVFYKLAYYS